MHGYYIGKIQISFILKGTGKLHGDNREKLRNRIIFDSLATGSKQSFLNALIK